MPKGDLWFGSGGQLIRRSYTGQFYPLMYFLTDPTSSGYSSYANVAVHNGRLVFVPYYYRSFNTQPHNVGSGITFYSYDVSNPQQTNLDAVRTTINLTWTTDAYVEITYNQLHYDVNANLFVYSLVRENSTGTARNTRVWTSPDGIAWTLVFNTASTSLSFPTENDKICSGFVWHPTYGRWVFKTNSSQTSGRIVSTVNFSSFSVIGTGLQVYGYDRDYGFSGGDLYYRTGNAWPYIIRVSSTGSVSALYPWVSGETRSSSAMSIMNVRFSVTGQILFAGYHTPTVGATKSGWWTVHSDKTKLEFAQAYRSTSAYFIDYESAPGVPLNFGPDTLDFSCDTFYENSTYTWIYDLLNGSDWTATSVPVAVDMGGALPVPEDFEVPVTYIPALDDDQLLPPYVWTATLTGTAPNCIITAQKFSILGELLETFQITSVASNLRPVICARNDYVVIGTGLAIYTRLPGGTINVYTRSTAIAPNAATYTYRTFLVEYSAYSAVEMYGSRDGISWQRMPGAPGYQSVRFTTRALTFDYDAVNGRTIGSSFTSYECYDTNWGASYNYTLPVFANTPPAITTSTYPTPAHWGHPAVKNNIYYSRASASYCSATPTGVYKRYPDGTYLIMPFSGAPAGRSAGTVQTIWIDATGAVNLTLSVTVTGSSPTVYELQHYKSNADETAMPYQGTLLSSTTSSNVTKFQDLYYSTYSPSVVPKHAIQVLSEPVPMYVSVQQDPLTANFQILHPLGTTDLPYANAYYLTDGTLEEDPFWTEEQKCVEQAKLYGL